MLVTTLWRCRCLWFWFPPYSKESITSFVISAIAKLWIEGPTSLSHWGCLSRSCSPLVECNYKFRLLHVWHIDVQTNSFDQFQGLWSSSIHWASMTSPWRSCKSAMNLSIKTYVCPFFNSFNFDVYDNTIENLCNLQNARFSLCFKHSGRMQKWKIMFIT